MNALAKPCDPLILADGTMIDPISGRIVRDDVEVVEIPSSTEAQRIVTNTRRTIADLPNVPDTMNPINIVLCYDMFGMSVQEIAVATRLSVDQVSAIQSHDAYNKMRSVLYESVLKSSEDDVVDILTRGRKRAAEKLYSLANSQDDDIALKASSQILTHAKDVGRKDDGMDTMEIKIVRKNANQEMPNITINL